MPSFYIVLEYFLKDGIKELNHIITSKVTSDK